MNCWVGGLLASGARAIVHIVAMLLDVEEAAVSPPDVPIGTGDPLSVDKDVIRPPPVPTDWSRRTAPAGSVHPLPAEDLSAQYETSHAPAEGTDTVGVLCAAV